MEHYIFEVIVFWSKTLNSRWLLRSLVTTGSIAIFTDAEKLLFSSTITRASTLFITITHCCVVFCFIDWWSCCMLGDDCTSTTPRRPWDAWQRVEEGWLSKKRQYEMFTDRDGRSTLPGIRWKFSGDDVQVDAKDFGRDCHVHQWGRGFPRMERLPASSSTKQSVKMSER